MFKSCKGCNQVLSLDYFYKYKNKPRSVCKTCFNERAKRYYNKRDKKSVSAASWRVTVNKVNEFQEWKSNLYCQNCNESDPSCLEFHHIESDEKEFEIGEMIRSKGKKTLVSELRKCVCLCSNCHRKYHAGRILRDFVPLNVDVVDIWPNTVYGTRE